MTLILPVLVAVFGILSVYGRRGLAGLTISRSAGNGGSRPTVCRASCWRTSFNMPMATRLLLQALFPRAACRLGMRGYAFFRLVEWPWRGCSAVAALIFMLCFASFATVLSGRRPKATTIELAIYGR